MSLSWCAKEGAIEFIALSFIEFQIFNKFLRSLSISFFVLLDPAVLTIIPISFGISIWFRIFLIFFLSEELNIFLEMPPPFGVFGIKTIYFPAIDIKVLNAAPFNPLSSFKTWTSITWFGLITSWILYLLEGNFFSFFFILFIMEFFSDSSMFEFLSSMSGMVLFSSSCFSLSFSNSTLASSSSFLIFSKSLIGSW